MDHFLRSTNQCKASKCPLVAQQELRPPAIYSRLQPISDLDLLLYEKGYTEQTIMSLYQFIDGIMVLPEDM